MKDRASSVQPFTRVSDPCLNDNNCVMIINNIYECYGSHTGSSLLHNLWKDLSVRAFPNMRESWSVH